MPKKIKRVVKRTRLMLSVGSDGYWLHIENPRHQAAAHLCGVFGQSDYSRTLGPALAEAFKLGCVQDNRDRSREIKAKLSNKPRKNEYVGDTEKFGKQ